MNQVIRKVEACAAESIKWASRRDLKFDTAKTEASLFTPMRGHKKHHWPNLNDNINVGNCFVRFIKEATRWLGVWMAAQLTFKEHHNLFMENARAAEARLRALTKMDSIVPERVAAIQKACVQVLADYASELGWDPKVTSRREDLQLLFNQQARSTLAALPTTHLGTVMRYSELTPAPLVLDSRQQQLTTRLANACEGLKLKMTYNHHTLGASTCRVITKEQERGQEAGTMC